MSSSKATTITHEAAEFVASVTYEDLSEDVLHMGRRCVLDGIGQIIAGNDTEATEIVREQVAEQGGSEEALLPGGGTRKVPAVLAARVLGTACHALDWDDTQMTLDPRHVNGLLTHPTNTPLSAAIAFSQRVPGVAGKDLMLAFQAGFEVECKIAEWMLPDVYKRGFHASASIGTFAACSTAAKLLNLGRDEIVRALGISASLSAAGIRANVGTMTKPLHFGAAAEAGIMAAVLARKGLSASPAGLDGHFGFCSVFAGGVFEEKLEQGFGRTLTIVDPGVLVKPYPSGILSHQSMDAMLKLVSENGLDAADVDTIIFHAGSNILRPLNYSHASNHLEAKFCMPALLAMIVLRRRAGKQEFTDEFIMSPEMQDLQGRITTRIDDEIESMGFDKIRSRIEVTMKDGRTFSTWSDERYRGGPELPMSDDELKDKFAAATAGILSDARMAEVMDLAMTFDLRDGDPVSELAQALQT